MQTDITIIDVAPGLWVWRTLQRVACAEGRGPGGGLDLASGGEVAVVDALTPPA